MSVHFSTYNVSGMLLPHLHSTALVPQAGHFYITEILFLLCRKENVLPVILPYGGKLSPQVSQSQGRWSTPPNASED